MVKVIVVTFCALWLIGCGAEAGSQYLGKWQHVKYIGQTLQIDRNGDSIIIRESSPSMTNGQIKTQNLPATLKDGTLQVSGEIGTVSFVIDQSTGNLIGPKSEYKKIQ